MPVVLRIETVWKSYAAGVRGCSIRAWVLRGCTLQLSLGERIAIVGAPASGKSTLLRCIAGELRADAGHIHALVPVISPSASERELRHYSAIQLIDDDASAIDRLRFGNTAIVASRDVARVRTLVDRILILRDGRLAPMTHIAVRRVAEQPVRPTAYGKRGSSAPETVPA